MKTKVLLLAANPLNTSLLKLGEEIHAIDKGLKDIVLEEKLEFIPKLIIRIRDLETLLAETQPDIVHFSGHGSSIARIILEDQKGDARPILAQELNHIFKVAQQKSRHKVRCVFLNACYTQPQAQAIAQHVDCVIGTSTKERTGTIGNDSDLHFAVAIYRALTTGTDIRTAYNLGRQTFNTQNTSKLYEAHFLSRHNDPSQVIFVLKNSKHNSGDYANQNQTHQNKTAQPTNSDIHSLPKPTIGAAPGPIPRPARKSMARPIKEIINNKTQPTPIVEEKQQTPIVQEGNLTSNEKNRQRQHGQQSTIGAGNPSSTNGRQPNQTTSNSDISLSDLQRSMEAAAQKSKQVQTNRALDKRVAWFIAIFFTLILLISIFASLQNQYFSVGP
ncbi:MAG: CHAT domain-containing protein [Chloroflexota bacterium]